MNRTASIAHAATEVFDICIIGGGATGAGLMANAVERGWKAVLIEKNDFASGTSSKSSKIIHGGLRYLKNLHFRLVYEALQERKQLLNRYPHLVKPIAFLLPFFHLKTDQVIKDLFLILYDLLAGKAVIKKHRKLNKEAILEKNPGITKRTLKGGILYWEALTNDARLTTELIAEAVMDGQFAFNYMEAISFQFAAQNIQSLTCRDHINGNELILKATVFINATGPWTDQLLAILKKGSLSKIKPAKGVHVVIPSNSIKMEYAIIIPSVNKDKRYLYAIPWQDNLTLLGATDTEYHSSPDEVRANKDEVNYILDAVNACFPAANLSYQDILSVFAGLRPLLAGNAKAVSYKRTREYEIWWTNENLINIAGGKFTSMLSMGKRCLEVISIKFRQLKIAKFKQHLESESGVGNGLYGRFTGYMNEILKDEAIGDHPISENFILTEKEIIFYIRFHFAEKVEDLLTRRTTVTYSMKVYDVIFIETIATLMAKELNKERNWIAEQMSAYYQHWLEYHPSFLNN